MAEDSSNFRRDSSRQSPQHLKKAASGNVDAHVLQQAMRRVIGRWVGRHLRRRPMIVPVVVLQWRADLSTPIEARA